jgi:dephospho-CoA kinase
MPVVALTGGVASGKTTVSEVLRARGAVIIDADLLARDAVTPGSAALEAIVARFGAGILEPEGTLNRQALGAIVFSDEQARMDLNAIVHPRVKELYTDAVATATREHPDRVLIYAIPLLSEARSADEFDVVVVVDAPSEMRVQRLVDHRGLTAEEATARVSSQAGDGERLALADVVLDASGDIDHTERAAHELFDELSALWPDRLAQLSGAFPTTPS